MLGCINSGELGRAGSGWVAAAATNGCVAANRANGGGGSAPPQQGRARSCISDSKDGGEALAMSTAAKGESWRGVAAAVATYVAVGLQQSR
jgi:hypothetical protein